MKCNDLPRMLADLREATIENLSEKIKVNGKPTGITIENGIELEYDFEVDGELISHITDEHLVADGQIYDFSAIDLETLIEIVESL